MSVELTVLMPCLNEARTLGACVEKAMTFLSKNQIVGEVLVADNGSTDGSQDIASTLGARVIPVPEKGYGNALAAGIRAAAGTYVIMGDSDDSYDFLGLLPFVTKLRAGYDLVLGNRFAGGIRPGAMPSLHRLFGNPLLTLIGRTLYGSPSKDFYCGLRGFRRDTISALELDSSGMEFALEMIVKATIAKLRITEVPTTLSPDGRGRPPHLRSWRDGWRSLRLFLLLSPRGLFLYPGLTLLLFGLLGFVLLLPGDIHIGRMTFAYHTFLVACSAIIVGVQTTTFWIFAKIAAIRRGLLPPDSSFERFVKIVSVELGSAVGGAMILAGALVDFAAVAYWGSISFGTVDNTFLIRVVATASTAVVLGFHVLCSAFFMYLLDYALRKRST